MARAQRQPSQVMIGLPQQPNLRPAFTVKRLTETRPHVMNIYDKKDNKIKSKTVQEPGGFLVTFYKGHSIRCRDEEHLRRIGAGARLVPLVNDEGEVKGAIENQFSVDPDDVEEATGEA